MEQTDADLRFELTGGAFDNGVLIRDDVGAIEELHARMEDDPASRLHVLVGDGLRHNDGPVEGGLWPLPPDGPWLRLWQPRQGPPAPSVGEDPETLRRPRALGYVD